MASHEDQGYVGSDCTRCDYVAHLIGVVEGTSKLIDDCTSCPLTLESAIRLRDQAERELLGAYGHSDRRPEYYRTLLTDFRACLRDESKYWNLIVGFRKVLRAHYLCQYKNRPIGDVKRALPILYRYDERFTERNVECQIRHTWDDLFEQMDKEEIETEEAPARFWVHEDGRVLKSLPATPYTDIVNRIGDLCCERGEGRDWDACLFIIQEWLTTKGTEVSSVDYMEECLENVMWRTGNDANQLQFRFNNPQEEDERELIEKTVLEKQQLIYKRVRDEMVEEYGEDALVPLSDSDRHTLLEGSMASSAP